MKTTFSRMYTLFAVLILLCLFLMGASFRLLLNSYLEDEKQEIMHNNAVTLSNLASAYDAMGEMETRWGDFHIALTSSARMAGTDAVLCGLDGRVWVCGCGTIGCVHMDQTVDPGLMAEILEQKEVFRESTIGGIYDEPQYMEASVVESQITNEEIAVLILTASKTDVDDVLSKSTILFFYVSVLVLIVAMVAIYLISRSQAGAIQTVTRAANRFGRGELDVRVPVGGKNTVEVDELAAAFNTMADSLAQSERQRQEFVANVSHELKTPMTTISGFVDGMLDGTIPQGQHPQYMQLVSDEVRRLSRLVRSMLEVSRLRSQGISEEKMRRFDLTETVGQVLITFERRVSAKAIHMDVDLPDRSIWVKADPDSITQVIYNLIDNGVKFCSEGGRLTIGMETEGGKAKVTIQNTGDTVSPEELPFLFDRFHKADKSRSADREGVGLGLYIVKTILNSHGEDISVTSRDGVTAFTFTLPMVR